MKRPLVVFAAGVLFALYFLQFISAAYQLALFVVLFFFCGIVFALNKSIANRKIYIVLLAVIFSSGINFLYTHYIYQPVVSFSDKVITASGYINDIPSPTSVGGYSYTMQVTEIKSQEKSHNKSFKMLIYTNQLLDIKALKFFR
jgi:hypothetical protein